MIPDHDKDGYLPPGEHTATWDEFEQRFGGNVHREWLLKGLRRVLNALKRAGCRTAYVDGSFVTTKDKPSDFDGIWDARGVDAGKLDPVLLDFDNGRIAQKTKYQGEFFPAQLPEGASGKTFLAFFQTRSDTGDPKGIVRIDLDQLS